MYLGGLRLQSSIAELVENNKTNKRCLNLLLFWIGHPYQQQVSPLREFTVHISTVKLILPPLTKCLSSSFLSLAATPPSDQAYVQAAVLFQQLRPKTVTKQHLCYLKKTGKPQQECSDKSTQRQAFQLAFNTLKCMKYCFQQYQKMMAQFH